LSNQNTKFLTNSVANCSTYLSNDEYYISKYLDVVKRCLDCELWGPVIIFCAIAIESHFHEVLDINYAIATDDLLERACKCGLINQGQKEIAKCIIAIRNAHAHPYKWLFEETKKQLKNCTGRFGQERSPWYRELSRCLRARTSRKIIMLENEELAANVVRETLKLICPSILGSKPLTLA